jgi:hypothetical protein
MGFRDFTVFGVARATFEQPVKKSDSHDGFTLKP